jgi:hypothetical protein
MERGVTPLHSRRCDFLVASSDDNENTPVGRGRLNNMLGPDSNDSRTW